MTRNVLNFVAFQGCWFANVLGAANGMPWAGPLVTMAWMAAHFASLRASTGRHEAGIEARLILAAVALGWAADSALVLANLLSFPQAARLGAPSPVWMVALWVCFAATLRHSLGWLRGRWLLGAFFGAVGGPLAYLGGQALGAIALAGNPALVAVSVQYALAMPLLLAVVQHAQRASGSASAGVASEIRS